MVMSLVNPMVFAQNPGAEFSLKLFKGLAKSQSEDNFLFSPYAVRFALGMAALGAKGKTQKQLGKAPEPWISKKEPLYKLFMANRIWVHLGFPLNEEYMDAHEKSFGVRPWMSDFSKSPDFVKDRVNGWVAERTQGKIKSMITEDTLGSLGTFNDPFIRMMLTSTLYFKGNWVSPFDRSETHEGQFATQSAGKIKVPFMRKTGPFNYLKTSEMQILEIPYLDGEISMVILLPNSEEDLGSFENSLKVESLDQWITELSVKVVQVLLPKFDFEFNLDLKEQLKAMGISDPFSLETADFSGMDGTKNLFISSLIHQTSINTDEEGSEAISHGGASISRNLASISNSGSSSVGVFRADHPFLFFIRHRGSNSIIFAGHVNKPVVLPSKG